MIKDYADNENTLAQIFLADMYNYSFGVQKDSQQAMNYYMKAGNSKDIYSQFMYINLMLSAQDYQSLQEEKLDALDADSGEKDFDSGMQCYGMQQYPQALSHFLISAEHGNSGAAFMIGRIFEDGLGIVKNPATARSWYQKAADKGHPAAKNALERLSGK